MSSKNRTQSAGIDWNENKQPVSSTFDDVYFSVEDGLAETEHVFIQGNQLSERFTQLRAHDTFTIMETGFGTGLNFLATWRCFKTNATKNCRLHFVSIEKYPLRYHDLKNALQLWPELDTFSAQLLANYPPQPWLRHQRISIFDEELQHDILLTLVFDEVESAIESLSTQIKPQSSMETLKLAFGERFKKTDAWFLDGFAPAKNPEMWTNSLYQAMAKNSHTNSSFATFTAAGHVRRGLSAAGFECEKTKGFGRKREMLRGRFTRKNPAIEPENEHFTKQRIKTSTAPNWLLKDSSDSDKKKTVLVIGAGLAGCHVAHALALRDFKVTVLESKNIASGASSNRQGVVYTRLSDSSDALSEFNLSAQLYADQFYHRHQAYELFGEACGVMHLAYDQTSEKRLTKFADLFKDDTRHFEYLNRELASIAAGLELKYPALLSKHSGWLAPAKLCEHLLAHPNISVKETFRVTAIHYAEDEWHAEGPNESFHANYCIISNAADALRFKETQFLPLKRIRGQVTHLAANSHTQPLTTVLCGKGYITPQTDLNDETMQSLGATYNLDSEDTQLTASDHQSNLDHLTAILSGYSRQTTELAETSGKVGFRCTTNDYFPIVGPVPDLQNTLDRFDLLRHKANADIDNVGAYLPKLYVNVGYGSRGLAYTPLMASLLADLIEGDYLSLSRSMYAHVHPARFAIRQLIKSR